MFEKQEEWRTNEINEGNLNLFNFGIRAIHHGGHRETRRSLRVSLVKELGHYQATPFNSDMGRAGWGGYISTVERDG